MNIFETIAKVSSQSERYHSQFLADALNESLSSKGDRSLFDGFWNLAAPHWEVPRDARVSSEEDAGSGRIDICIRCDDPIKRILGIEVKTVEASAQRGQLERYQEGLRVQNPGYEISVSYLTPFNRERAGKLAGDDVAHSLSTVMVFKEFHETFPNSQHLSWLDVAALPWDGNDLWKQHQAYVLERISSKRILEKVIAPRQLAEIFGTESSECFLGALSDLGFWLDIQDDKINLSNVNTDLPSFAKDLANAFKILLDSEHISKRSRRSDTFPDELRQRFLDSHYRVVHEALFGLSRCFSFVWVVGDKDYAIRIAHEDHKERGVSLVRSYGPCRLGVTMLR